ncbi:MAG: carboxy terminal-processing peptidase [Bacteroidetes bacterium]|nr:carboxy terminal-processing peptidase [Bacteroidota bacterium]
MKTSLFLVPVFFLCSFIPSDKELVKDETLIKVIIENLNAGHYKPLPIDDDFSKKAYSLYVKRLDINKRFLIKEDIDQLKQYEYLVDDEIKNGTFKFFDLSNDILNKRVKEAESYCTEILSSPFSFTTDESVETDGDKRDFAKDEKTLKEDWRKILKYEVLSRIDEQLNIQEKAQEKKDTSVEIKTFAQLEKDAREKVKKRYDDYYHRLSQDRRDDRLSFYLNCIVNVYDPHTDYFPPKDKENFDIQMSGQLEGIGAQLQEKDGYIKVAGIVPGSPSWKQGQLKEGFIILKVAQGNAEPVDVVDMRLDDAVKLVRGKKGTEVRLTVKKPDGSLLVIPIIRDVVVLEETFAKSAILRIPGSDIKIGYIYLPSFYADFTNGTGRRAFTDVKKEIEKLSDEKIDGIIFDLRNDGGGSLQDAVDIAGLFIEKGPVVQVKARYGAPYVYEDHDPEVQYGGPLVVMTNTYSASASEIFSAAMQDYNRAVIIGTPNTYGKGTVQRFVELDKTLVNQDPDLPPLGSLKVTIQKFYRINGGSTQLKGVTPDIILPDVFAFIDRGERESDFPMAWTSIDPVPYTKWNIPPPIQTLKQKTEARIDHDSVFNLITDDANRLKKMKNETNIPLQLDKYRRLQKKLQEESKKYDKIGRDSTGLFVRPLNVDLPKINADTSSKARAEAWEKNLKKDVYLYQASQVMKDYNMLQPKR